jgi:hypothetical protein
MRAESLTKLAGDWDWKPVLKDLVISDQAIFEKYNI